MKIAVLSPTSIPTPPRGYGGIERLVAYFVEELEKRGHEVRLYASPGSIAPRGGLVECMTEKEVAESVYSESEGFDFIIDWTHLKLASSVIDDRIYSVVFWTDNRGRNPVYSSKAVARAFNDAGGKVIYPGIDLSRYEVSEKRDDFYLFFSRIIPEKGVERVISIARAAGVELVVAGHTGAFSYDPLYVESIREMCHGDIIWGGDVDERGKIELLRKAKAILFYPRWIESFWIVGVEAMACGCPVIVSLGSGGPEEQVIHGKTGFICSNYREFIEVLKRDLSSSIDPRECRKRAEYFRRERMVEDWLRWLSGRL